MTTPQPLQATMARMNHVMDKIEQIAPFPASQGR